MKQALTCLAIAAAAFGLLFASVASIAAATPEQQADFVANFYSTL